jgi:hypothetical protein
MSKWLDVEEDVDVDADAGKDLQQQYLRRMWRRWPLKSSHRQCFQSVEIKKIKV